MFCKEARCDSYNGHGHSLKQVVTRWLDVIPLFSVVGLLLALYGMFVFPLLCVLANNNSGAGSKALVVFIIRIRSLS